MRIIGPPSADHSVVRSSLVRMGATELFLNDILPAVWGAALQYAVDPVGAVAQSYKETGGGRFGGKVKPQFYNTCGLKIKAVGFDPLASGDEPFAHQIFWSWEIGALAHIQHLRAYANCPVSGPILDPRYFLVIGKHRCEHFSDLGGKWAPSRSYGAEVEAIAVRLSTPAGGTEV